MIFLKYFFSFKYEEIKIYCDRQKSTFIKSNAKFIECLNFTNCSKFLINLFHLVYYLNNQTKLFLNSYIGHVHEYHYLDHQNQTA